MNLNEDIIIEVLMRLPAQYLVLYKTVCKKWRDLIENSTFVNRHLNLHQGDDDDDECILMHHFDRVTSKHIITYYDDDDESYESSAPLQVHVYDDFRLSSSSSSVVLDDDYINVVTSYDGIVCLTNYSYTVITLINPALGREFTTLPPIPFGCPTGFSSTCFGIGFGFDSSRKEHKVVRLGLFKPVNNSEPFNAYMEAEIYSFSTDSWRKSSDRINASIRYVCSPVLFNGILHSCFMGRTHPLAPRESFHIITFNMTTELFDIMKFPPGWGDCYQKTKPTRLNVFVVDSTIALVAYTFPGVCQPCVGGIVSGNRMDVWLMEEYGVTRSWIKQYSVILPDIRVGKPLSFWKKDKLLSVTTDGWLICSNLRTGKHHQIQKYRFQTQKSCGCGHMDQKDRRELDKFGVTICKQSLLPVNKL